ncbi:hypothetical protein ACT80S_10385 [Ramlibacter sp. MAHUQ-53]|uniref:hypothetical protein n=1 Tax=unclassified Ramlibacter TaxID=2617605 RepID=UPI00363677E1
MKAIVTLACAVATLAPVAARATDVGVSVQISQPGVYGRIDIGRYPQPAIILPQPVVIVPPGPAYVVQQQPVYMWVPPGHRKKWSKHCHQYNACGVPVYFVRHDWYDSHVRHPHPGAYGPGDHRRDRGDRDDKGGRGRGHDRDHDRDRR